MTGGGGPALDPVSNSVGVGQSFEDCSTYGKCLYAGLSLGSGSPANSSWTNWYYYGDSSPPLRFIGLGGK
jgi:hypothetical protein